MSCSINIKEASVKNVDGYTDENGGWISEKDDLDVYVVRTAIGTSQRLNRQLSANKYGVIKISERAINTRQSSIAGYPRYWWRFDIEKGKPTHWLLINGNVRATVFNGRGEFVQSGYEIEVRLRRKSRYRILRKQVKQIFYSAGRKRRRKPGL